MIVTFLALLEMIRLKLIRVFQSGGRSARFASTSARVRPTRRTRLAIPNDQRGTRKNLKNSPKSKRMNRTSLKTGPEPRHALVADDPARPGPPPRSRRSSRR